MAKKPRPKIEIKVTLGSDRPTNPSLCDDAESYWTTHVGGMTEIHYLRYSSRREVVFMAPTANIYKVEISRPAIRYEEDGE